MMKMEKARLPYSEDKELDSQILILPYIGSTLVMTIILPKERDGLASLEKKIISSPTFQQSLRTWSSATPTKVNVDMPKFKFTQGCKLTELLKEMGMELLFDEHNANMARIDGEPDNLYVSDVVHKAFIDVNEKGTEAAAATAANCASRCCLADPERVPNFRADHPFFFLINDKKNGTILFMGRASNPEDFRGKKSK